MKRLFVFVYMMLFVVIGTSAQSNTTFGDVNNDGHVNYTDVDMISDIIMGKLPYSDAADINKDGKVDASDIVEVINVLKDNINQIAEDIDHVNSIIVPLFLQCESISDLSQHLPTIKEIEGVENAWTDNQTLFVKIRNYNTILFSYPPAPHSVEDLISTSQIQSLTRSSIEQSKDHTPTNAQKACVYYQMEKDEVFDEAKKISKLICDNFNKMGISCQRITNVGTEFFIKDIFEYDLIYLCTHGCYDINSDTHWLCTSYEIKRYDEDSKVYKYLDLDSLAQYLKDHYYSQYGDFLTVGCQKEMRDGKVNAVYYTFVSDKYIDKYGQNFSKNDAIIINTACQSLKKNENLAKAFLDKGASCYLGYDDTNGIGHWAGYAFYTALLNGCSVKQAFDKMPSGYKEETGEENGLPYNPHLGIVFNNNGITCITHPNTMTEEGVSKICIFHPETLSDEKKSYNNNTSISLRGRIKILNSKYFTNSFKYGFQWSTNSDMSQPESKETDTKNYDDATLYMNWELTLTDKDLKSNTTYYYRAYMNDGYSYCYGDIKSFTTTGDDVEDTSNYIPYYVQNNGVRTYYFDNKYDKRGEYIFLGPHSFPGYGLDEVEKIIFDVSFKRYQIPSYNYGFHSQTIKCIEGLCYLNTSNRTSMEGFFSGCSSLETIDLSGLNTSNVKNMFSMFSGCSSLETIDLSGLNTSNVNDMRYMFSYCSSLKTIIWGNIDTSNVTTMEHMFENCGIEHPDLSQLKTVNVTNMESMFYNCTSLTHLDLRSFNTSKVTNMGSMFYGCTSLIDIDLSSFDTSNVEIMSGMFACCKSLSVLDLSNFKTVFKSLFYGTPTFSYCSSLSKIYVAGDWTCESYWTPEACYIFYGCEKLMGGMGTKLGENYYYDERGKLCSYSVYGFIINARIDGGKDNPGLFTAK